MTPEIPQLIRSRQKILEHSDRILAQNFDADLAGIVILARDAIFVKKMPGGVETHSKAPIRDIIYLFIY